LKEVCNLLKEIIYDGNIEEIVKTIGIRKDDMDSSVNETVKEILADVKLNGDEAVLKYAKKFDGFEVETASDLLVSEKEIQEAMDEVGDDIIRILERTKNQLIEFHKNQIQKSWSLYKKDGVMMGQIVRGLAKVAIYVPGGTASYPSTVLMNAVPAKLAGVEELIMSTPVKQDGKVAPIRLAAAKICGVDKIYKIGGIQAIGALAYGTQIVPKVDKIVGPGNIFVATAKKQCYGLVGIDMIAGPSEVLIIADKDANAKYIAADLMSQAEHDKLSSCILITDSKELIKKVNIELERQLKYLQRKEFIESAINNYSAAVIVKSFDEAFEISNQVAPEHLEIMLPNPVAMLPKVKNAGSIFLGENTPEPLGDYMSGTNHVLPTEGSCKFYSGLGVYDFIKYSSYSYYPREVLETFKEDVIKFANIEGFDAHANSMAVRFED